MKVEVTEEDGTRYSLAMHGNISQEKILKVMDMLDILGEQHSGMKVSTPDGSTTYGKIFQLIQTSYPMKEFSSADITRDYEEQYGSQISLSTVSTYLSRLSDRGSLKRQKFGNSWVYHLNRLAPDQLPR